MATPKARPENLREACVREAMGIIGEEGIDALSLRDVARRLGVSHQAPYKHFPSRDHILAEIVARAYASFAAYLDARPRSDDPYKDLGLLGRAYLDYAREHPLHYRLMFGVTLPDPEQHPDMMHQARHAFSALRAAIERLPEGSAPCDKNLDALFAWAVVHGLATILESEAAEKLGFGPSLFSRAPSYILELIGAALRADGRK